MVNASTPVMNGLAIVMLLGMLAASAISVWRWRQPTGLLLPQVWWQIPLAALAGLGIMGMLIFLGTRPETAVCVPHADCLILQESKYARPLALPIGVWGAAAYLLALLAWALVQFGGVLGRRLGFLLLMGTAAGTQVFAVYFTFLEPFVLGVTCAWCLAAAAVSTLLFWYSMQVLHGVTVMRSFTR